MSKEFDKDTLEAVEQIENIEKLLNELEEDHERSSEALSTTENSLIFAQRIARLGSWDWDLKDNKVGWSNELFRLTGYDKESTTPSYEALLKLTNPDDLEDVKSAYEEALKAGGTYSVDCRIITSASEGEEPGPGSGPEEELLMDSGNVEVVHHEGVVSLDDDGTPHKLIGTVQDVTRQKRNEYELKKLSMAIDQSLNIVFITNKDNEIEYVNSMFEKASGYTREEVIGKTPDILASGETPESQYEELKESLKAGKPWQGTFKNKTKSGEYCWWEGVISPIFNDQGETTNYLAVQVDATERKNSEERIQFLASYDEITGLVNRSHLMELFNKWLTTHLSADKKGVLLLVAIDKFKFINDTYGYSIGDEFLRRLGKLLQITLKYHNASYMFKTNGEPIIGRLGGDEFAVFLPGLDETDGADIAEEIRMKVEEFRFAEATTHLSASIGIVSFPHHGISTKELFTKADAAMYRAKDLGGNKCHLYKPEDRDLENIHSRLQMREAILKAIEDDRFIPWFQPILDLRTNGIHKYEVLARMLDTEGNLVMPGAFINIAETFGIIDEIDKVIIEKAMIAQAETSRQGNPLSFSMNLSGKEIGDEDLLKFLKNKIRETGAAPRYLIFEITETAAIHDLDRAITFIKDLKAIGCRFSLDDFGVGFTSFVYLKEMDVDIIKIDGSFIRKLDEDRHDQLFVKAMTDVASGLNIETVAEFVEKDVTLDLIKKIGIDYAQGYLIGKPGPEHRCTYNSEEDDMSFLFNK